MGSFRGEHRMDHLQTQVGTELVLVSGVMGSKKPEASSRAEGAVSAFSPLSMANVSSHKLEFAQSQAAL